MQVQTKRDTPILIDESGVTFEIYDKKIFYIEKSVLYKGLRDVGICSVEFILNRDSNLYFIEVKTSSPKIDSGSTRCKECRSFVFSEPKQCVKCNQSYSDWQSYVNELMDKYQHSLIMYSLLNMQRLEDDDFRNCLDLKDTNLDLKDTKIILLLIITTSKDWALNLDNIQQIQSQLQIDLKPLLKLWNAELQVWNINMAKEFNLIQSKDRD